MKRILSALFCVFTLVLGLLAVNLSGGGAGTTIVEAVDSVHWNEDSVLMAGSSKLAQRGELFLSSTTAKIMTKLPIPLVVVPRDYHPGRKGCQQQPWTGSIPIIKQ